MPTQVTVMRSVRITPCGNTFRRASLDAKQALDPDFVIMARCDLGGVPGASFAEIIERCQAYKAEAQVDVICPNGLRTWEEIQEAIRLIPGPVVPLIPARLSPYPSLQAQQDAGAAAAWFPALTTWDACRPTGIS